MFSVRSQVWIPRSENAEPRSLANWGYYTSANVFFFLFSCFCLLNILCIQCNLFNQINLLDMVLLDWVYLENFYDLKISMIFILAENFWMSVWWFICIVQASFTSWKFPSVRTYKKKIVSIYKKKSCRTCSFSMDTTFGIIYCHSQIFFILPLS